MTEKKQQKQKPKQKQKPPPKIATVKDWLKKTNVEFVIDLPSGLAIKAKRLDLLEMVIAGTIPMPLLNSSLAVAKSLDVKNPDSITKVSEDELADMRKLMQTAAILGVIEPAITDTGEGNSMDAREIPVSDLMFIFDKIVDVGVSTSLKGYL